MKPGSRIRYPEFMVSFVLGVDSVGVVHHLTPENYIKVIIKNRKGVALLYDQKSKLML